MNLGLPPRQFDFSYRDKDNNFHSESELTPQVFFFKNMLIKLDDYVSIINAPTADKPCVGPIQLRCLGEAAHEKWTKTRCA